MKFLHLLKRSLGGAATVTNVAKTLAVTGVLIDSPRGYCILIEGGEQHAHLLLRPDTLLKVDEGSIDNPVSITVQ